MNHPTFLRAKRIAFGVLAALIVIMAAATFLEHKYGTPFAVRYIYNARWFGLLWAVVGVSGIVWLRRFKRPLHVWLLHASLLVILIGAAVSFFTSRSGQIHLRVGKSTDMYQSGEQVGSVQHLPFTVTLLDFDVAYRNGTDMAMDYTSHIRLTDKDGSVTEGTISMNNVLSHGGVRFYQMSYDSDGQGSILALRMDRWGMALSYTGYVLFFIALIWMLFSPRGAFRNLLRSPLLKKGLTAIALFATATLGAAAQTATTLPRDVADDFGRLYVVYGGRVCPVQTLAQEFTSKLYGAPSYGDYTAEQVVTGWLFWPDEWNKEPIIKVKSNSLRSEFALDRYSSFNDFFMTDYRLAALVKDYYYHGNRSSICKDAADIDDKLQLIYSLRRGELFIFFPTQQDGQSYWVTPTEAFGAESFSPTDSLFVRNVFGQIFQDAKAGKFDAVKQGIAAIAKFQQKHGQSAIPDAQTVRAERLYNAFPVATWLFRIDLAIGLVLFVWLLVRIARRQSARQPWVLGLAKGGLLLSFLALTYYVTLRTIVSGHVPLSNGYETMLAIAWCGMLLTLIVTLGPARRHSLTALLLSFGYLVAGFFLLVASLGQMSPQITPLVPVLSSPLLSIHVSLIMVAYMLLSFTFLCSVTALIVRISSRRDDDMQERLQVVSRIFLMPALTFLGLGIFIGAVWAGESWGRYWGWDPKETWALITMLVYAIPAHASSLPALRRPATYHLYILVAFACVLMTYFGVNYYLTGLHSYAG